MNLSCITMRPFPSSNWMKCIAYRFLFLFIFFHLFSSTLRAQWAQLPGPFGGSVYFMERYAGAYWAGANSGLYRSVDGMQWDRVASVGHEPVIAAVADNDTMYILRSSKISQVLTTIDSGQSWVPVNVFNGDISNRVVMKKTEGVILISKINNQNYLRSKNNGASFQSLPGGGPQSPWPFDANKGLIALYNSGNSIKVSNNGGNSFFSRPLPPNNSYSSAMIILDSAIVSLGSSLSISFDTAVTWLPVSFPNGFDENNCTLRRSEERGLLLNSFGKFAYSEDYGINWQISVVPENSRLFLHHGNGQLISTDNGFYSSVDSGATWTNSSTGFSSHLVKKVYTIGNRLYAVVTDVNQIEILIYYTEFGSGIWTQIGTPSFTTFPVIGFQGADTIVTCYDISLNSGTTWTPITYPGVSSFGLADIEIHNNKAYMALDENIQVVPLKESPIAQKIVGPSNNHVYDMLFIGDTLYMVDRVGRAYRQFPNSFNWQNLTSTSTVPGNQFNLFHIHGRLYHPRMSNLLVSDNNGVSWENLSGIGIPWSPTNPIHIGDMIGIDTVLIAASPEIGLLFSNDKGVHWWMFQSGLPKESIKSTLNLAKNNEKVFVAMNRYGIWQRDVQIGSSTGVVFQDDNQNGVQDSTELPLSNQKVFATNSNNLTFTDSMGRYHLSFDLPADTVRTTPTVNYSNVMPLQYWVVGNQAPRNFGIWFQPNVTDLAIGLINTAPIRPGFDNSLQLQINNNGTIHSGATIGLKLPPGIVYSSANPLPNMIMGDSIIWHVDSIPFLATLSIVIQIQVSNAIPLAQLASFSASVSSTGLDINPDDNVFVLTTTVVGSYDPNDKQVWPGPILTPAQILNAEPLHYTIRFQNTGTYKAERVRLVDTLDAHLDLTSIAAEGASHPYSWSILSGHVLEVIFDNIQLPDSSSNEAKSHGFFSFSIAAKPDLPIGTFIRNEAEIFFDFNSPIITNEVLIKVSKPIFEINQDTSLCVGTVYYGQEIQEDTTFMIILPGITVDSLLQIQVTTLPSYMVSIDTIIELGDSISGIFYTKDTIFTLSLSTIHGCDSTVVVTITVIDSTSSVQDPTLPSGIHISPNPASEKINVRFDSFETGLLEIHAASGQVLYLQPIANQNELTLIVSDYPSGVYTICFRSARGYLRTAQVVIR